MNENLTPFEKTCKMIGEKYGVAARELLDRIKKRKEDDKLNNTSIKTMDESVNRK